MNEPPDHTAELSAANLLSPGGMTVPKCSRDELGVVAQGDVHAREQDPPLLQVFAVLVVHDLGLELGGDPGEVLALGLGDAQLLVGLLHALGEHVPVGDLPLGGLEVVVDVVEVDVGHVRGEPLEHRLALEALQRVEPELRHPLRLVLLPGDVADDGLVEALLGRVDVVVGAVVPAELVLAEIDPGNGHVRTPYWGSPQGFAGISTTAIVTIPGPDPQPGADRRALAARPASPRACLTSVRASLDQLLVLAELAVLERRLGLVELGGRLLQEVLRRCRSSAGSSWWWARWSRARWSRCPASWSSWWPASRCPSHRWRRPRTRCRW